MKLRFSILLGVAALAAQAAEHNREFDSGRDYYLKAEYRKAAARFHLPCDSENDAEACYWTGLSYERLGDLRTPFGCKADVKAHEYFSKALRLAPRREYRDALFEFLLSTSDCSRTALREAGEILSAIPESDPGYSQMSRRLQEEKQYHASAGARLGRMFLIVPQATYGLAALSSSRVSRAASGGSVGR